MKSLPEQCREWLKADLPGVNESELLRLSTEDDSPGHEFAADFRIGFRYGWPRGAKAERARTRPLDELFPEMVELLGDCNYHFCTGESNSQAINGKLEAMLTRIRQALGGEK